MHKDLTMRPSDRVLWVDAGLQHAKSRRCDHGLCLRSFLRRRGKPRRTDKAEKETGPSTPLTMEPNRVTVRRQLQRVPRPVTLLEPRAPLLPGPVQEVLP